MKRYGCTISMMILFMSIIPGCKKESGPPPKDYSLSINGKSWWGMLTYTGNSPEYYSVHFKSDKTLLWSQLSGDYPGQWVVNDNKLTMLFSGIGAEITAEISDDEKLMNIKDNTNSFTIDTGELLTTPDIPLVSTVWNGNITIGGNLHPIQLNFVSANSVQVKIGNVMYPNSYIRSPSGSAFRNNKGFFGIVTGPNELKGSDTYTNRPWSVHK